MCPFRTDSPFSEQNKLIRVYHAAAVLYNTLNMKNKNSLLWLGAWLFMLPFLGVSGAWKERLITLTGLFVIGAALYARYKTPPAHADRTQATETSAP